jgi:transcriptional regulator with XRE-family HTH domain
MSGDDYGARIRAAQAYAGLDQVALAQALAMSVRTLERIYSNERALTLPEVKKVAEVCGVPIGFLVEGWNANRPIHDRLAEIDRRLADVANASGELPGGAQDFREVAAAPEQ